MNELEPISTPDPKDPQSIDVGTQDSVILASTTFSPTGTTPTEATGTCSMENTSQFITIFVHLIVSPPKSPVQKECTGHDQSILTSITLEISVFTFAISFFVNKLINVLCILYFF